MHSFDSKQRRNFGQSSVRRQLAGSLTAAILVSPMMAHSASAQAPAPPVTTPITTPPTGGNPVPVPPKMSPTLVQQLSAILSDRATWSATRKKVASQLIYTARMAAGQPIVPGVQKLSTGVVVKPNGTVRVVIRTTGITSPLLQAIQNAGGTVTATYPLTNAIYADVPIQNMELIAARSDVHSVNLPARSKINGRRVVTPSRAPYLKAASGRTGNVVAQAGSSSTSIKGALAPFALPSLDLSLLPSLQQATQPFDEAYTTQQVASVSTTLGVTGAGVKVGVISTNTGTFNGQNMATAAMTATAVNPRGQTVTGLPTNVTIVQDGVNTDGEGTAMMEDVHALAPGAQLFFASGEISEDSFASNVVTLRSVYGCSIICDDIGYADESPFTDTVLGQAVNQVVAAGATYFSAAGNSGHLLTDNDSLCYEGDFVGVGSIDFTGTDDFGATVTLVGTVNGFGPNQDQLNTFQDPNSDFVTLAWADTYYSVSNQYEVFTTDPFGGLLDAESGTSAEPLIGATVFSGGGVGVILVSGNPVAMHLADFGDAFGSPAFLDTTNGGIVGHPAAAAAYGIAAAPATTAFETGNPAGPYPGVFTTTSPAEAFSTDGPRQIFYTVNVVGTSAPLGTPGSDGTGGVSTPITPGNFEFSTGGGTTLNKPDFIAGDGTHTIDPTGGLAANGLNQFFGTSCATPHAAAMAALLESFQYSSGGTTFNGPKMGLSETRPAFQANPIHVKSPVRDDNKGFGFINVPGAVNFLKKFYDPNGVGVTVTPGATSVTITWQTNIPANSVVYLGSSQTSTPIPFTGTTNTTNHSVTIPYSSFNATQNRYFRVSSTSVNGGVSFLSPTATQLTIQSTPTQPTGGSANLILANLQLTRTTSNGTPAILATMILANTGSGAAADVKLTAVTLAGNSPLSPALPLDLGALASTKSTTASMFLPSIATGTATQFVVTGTDGNGNTFTSTVRVTAP